MGVVHVSRRDVECERAFVAAEWVVIAPVKWEAVAMTGVRASVERFDAGHIRVEREDRAVGRGVVEFDPCPRSGVR
jgi:hypothetical protein